MKESAKNQWFLICGSLVSSFLLDSSTFQYFFGNHGYIPKDGFIRKFWDPVGKWEYTQVDNQRVSVPDSKNCPTLVPTMRTLNSVLQWAPGMFHGTRDFILFFNFAKWGIVKIFTKNSKIVDSTLHKQKFPHFPTYFGRKWPQFVRINKHWLGLGTRAP